MNPVINAIIKSFTPEHIPPDRKIILQPLINYIVQQHRIQAPIRLNFICTHNSRRSHLAQIWAQTLAYYYNIQNVYCYSGGTAITSIYPQIISTLQQQGFSLQQLSNTDNPVYAIKYASTAHPIIGFSKLYNNTFNPSSDYCAIMTCDSADKGCPIVLGAAQRFSITYTDPKIYDNSTEMTEKYMQTSMHIAEELGYVFYSVALKVARTLLK